MKCKDLQNAYIHRNHSEVLFYSFLTQFWCEVQYLIKKKFCLSHQLICLRCLNVPKCKKKFSASKKKNLWNHCNCHPFSHCKLAIGLEKGRQLIEFPYAFSTFFKISYTFIVCSHFLGTFASP